MRLLTAIACVAGVLIGGCGGSPGGAPTVTEPIVEAPFGALEDGDSLHLYFPGPGELLYEEERQLPPETDPERSIRAGAGPMGGGLARLTIGAASASEASGVRIRA